MRSIVVVLFSSLLIGCVEGESASAPDSPGGSPPPTSTPIGVTVKTGLGFSCISLTLASGGVDQIYCRTEGSPDPRLGILSASYSLYVEAPALAAFETWDDTICFSAVVTQRPLNRDAGLATYCMGDATLGFNQVAYPLVYGGPQYDHAANGTSEVSYSELPFVGGDVSMDLMTNTGGTWLVMLDTSVAVSESVETCDLAIDETTLTCNNFTAVIQ
jgi:hypothetical protein